ncbi:M4 family metallopeptidase [Lysobacter yangpyeongensis]|uniref:Neutral metalloproteinase n=1 Tax=Lysobacter yangpyeongensis TaxID=346182 RepID=A0ABW0SIZ5_9GAMM
MCKLSSSILLAILGSSTASAAVVDRSAAAGRALGHIRNHQAATRTSAGDQFVTRDVVVDADGTEHVRFDRTYEGLPVIGGDLVVHSRNGQYKSTSVTQGAALKLSTRPSIKATVALVIAGTEFGADFVGAPDTVLAVYARGKKAPRLAWQVRLHNQNADSTYIVDAVNGRILERWSNLHTAAVTGKARTLYSGEVSIVTNSVSGGYELRDPSRGGLFTIDGSNSRTAGQVYKDSDNTWGNYSNDDRATAAADAQYGASVTWDYFKSVHGRNGIANNGKGSYSRVHYGRRYSNAYWSDNCFCMTYGDGDGVTIGPLVALDITGHEMSHGVNANTANLIYSGESGGLNEANSDILGTMVEFHANNPQDTPDYMIGEEVVVTNVPGSADQRALRFMFNPAADGLSRNCYSSDIGTLDVHHSSGVANLFFYLLAEGTSARTFSGVKHAPKTCNGATFSGIGRAKAAKIWYRALSLYFTSSTDYAGARAATIQAAKDLYGTTSTEATAVARAWTAVKVN